MNVLPDGVIQSGTGLASETRTLDLVHLSRMTLGDRDLEAEVLALFMRQSEALAERAANADASQLPPLAHTLNGSARAVGAWRVADAAERLEARACGGSSGVASALAELRQAVNDVRAVIAGILQSA